MTPERTRELVVRATGVVVIASVAVALASLTWRLTGLNDGRAAIAAAETSPRRAVGPDADVARILALAPFGGGTDTTGLPASTLGLVLKGVMLAYPPEASLALIAAGDGAAQSYGVGAAPTANAVIEAIEINRVILRVGDAREILAFPQSQILADAPPSAVAAPVLIAPVSPPAQPVLSAQAKEALAAASPIASSAGARPPAPAPTPQPVTAAPTAASLGVTAGADGYRVGPNPSAELRRFGLRPGDVIASLNGQAVGDVAGDRQLFDRALASGGARVEVVRDGRRVTLTIPLR